MGFQWNPWGGSSPHCFPAGQIGIWKCWFLRREENRSTRRKTLGAGTKTNNKLNPHTRHRVQESNLGRIGGRPAWKANAQPLRHPCSPMKLVHAKDSMNLVSIIFGISALFVSTVSPVQNLSQVN